MSGSIQSKMLLLGCLFLAVGASVHGQSMPDAISQAFEQYRERHYEEKIYLHTAQSNYVTGEVFWCRVYLTDAHSHRLSSLSKVAYLELIDGRGRPVWQSAVRIDTGTGAASWQIPQSLSSGQYQLRAYTRWMRNQDPRFYFRKDILILNPARKPVFQPGNKDTIYLQAFPEGGQLVAGIENRITYLVQDAGGRGMSADLYLLRDGKDTLLHTVPARYGMGDFTLVPELGHRYSLKLTKPVHRDPETTLPDILTKGYAVRADATADRMLELKVTMSRNLEDKGCYLFLHCRNANPRAFYQPYRNKVAVFRLPLDELGEGISQLTVFNENRVPVAERLWFRQPQKRLKFDIITDASSYPKRSPIEVSIQAVSENGKSLASSFSASIIRMPDTASLEESDILSYLYLASDLPGHIENPGFYFSMDSALQANQADLLMRTQGWRRFRWENILGNDTGTIRYLPEFSGPLADVQLTGKSGKQPLPGRPVALTVSGRRYHLALGISDSTGKLTIPLQQREGSAELAFQVLGPGSDTVLVLPVPFFDSSVAITGQMHRQGDEKAWKAVEEEMVDAQLSQAFGLTQLGGIRAYAQTDTTPFYGLADKSYQLDDYVRFTTMEEVFREYVREVDVRKNRSQYRLLVYNLPMKSVFQDDPLILLDGLPIRDINKVMAFDPLKIKSIDILARRYHLGGLSFPGIISMQTYNGNFDGFELPPGLLVTDYEGLQVWREFSSPSYPSATNNRRPDLRRLLYWLPDGTTTAGKSTSLRIFSADLPGRYAIIVQGIDNEGRAGSAIRYITVQ